MSSQGEFLALIAYNYKPERVQVNDLMQLKILEKQEKIQTQLIVRYKENHR